eukprot:GEMP01040609.1.p1 GENE.GEMP01040609.1~~GEMP01040609.1.p1  ORF type:complete len:326 (+),score=89.47 GEMP01040609.1:107-1084(+)
MRLSLALLALTTRAKDLHALLLEKAPDHANGEPFQLDVYMSSDCPYSQDFIPRHLIKVMQARIPAVVNIWPAFDAKHNVDDDGKVCLSRGSPGTVTARQTCLANMAVACVFHSTTLAVPDEVRTDFLYQHIERFQQCPFNDDKLNPMLYEEIIKEVEGLDLDAVNTCIDDEGADLAQLLADKFEEGQEAATTQYKELTGHDIVNMHGIFPYLFVDHLFIPMHNGQLFVHGFGVMNLKEILCHISDNVPACEASNVQKYQHNVAVHSPVWFTWVQWYGSFMTMGLAVLMVVWWVQSRMPTNRDHATRMNLLAERDEEDCTELGPIE